MAKTELQMLFYSPIAWIILVVFMVQCGMLFSHIMNEYVLSKEMGYSLSSLSYTTFAHPYKGFFIKIQSYLYLYIPLLTMSIVSKELSSGSIKLLYSSPLTNFQIIGSKFLSMMIYGAIMMLGLSLFAFYGLFTIKDFDFSLVLTGILGLYLLLCAYAAIGIFMSSLTSYQIVAAIGTLAILMGLNMVGKLGQDYDIIRDITYWFQMSGRSNTFVGGLLCSEDVLYFLVVIALFLSLTIIRLKSIRHKNRFIITVGRYMGVVILACGIGYFSSLPMMKSFYDTTDTKLNTLTPNSQDIIKKLDGNVTITTYINILDPNSWFSSSFFLKRDMDRFTKYLRFKPDMKLKYVYYYDHAQNTMLDRRYPDLSDRERMLEICRIYGYDTNKFVRPEVLHKKIDLSGEGYTFVRQIVRENGEKSWLRIYNDMAKYPSEREISAAFKRMVMKLPIVGFITGHGERSIDDSKDRAYSSFAKNKSFRYSLMNQGFDVSNVSLSEPISQNINIVVLSDMRTSFSDEEAKNLQKYINRGGNLYVLAEPKRRKVMNPILKKYFGYIMTEGLIVKRDSQIQADIIAGIPTKKADDIAYDFKTMRYESQVISMPSVAGLMKIEDLGFKTTTIFRSDSSSWNELQTTDFVDDTIRYNPQSGEIQKAYPLVVALSRKINNKEQKILLTGDADCISSGEFRGRRHMRTSNYSLITGGFFWLSDNEVPIDVRRPEMPDNEIYIGKTGVQMTRILFTYFIPLILLLMGIIIWIRRRSR